MPNAPAQSNFAAHLERERGERLQASSVQTLMLNIGLACPLSCAHCHHSCSPQRTEMMEPAVADACIDLARTLRPQLVDITGGAPELHPELPRLIAELTEAGIPVRVRTNLVVLGTTEGAAIQKQYATHGVRLLASMPGGTPAEVDAQRGNGVFERSVDVLRALCARGYGRGGGLVLDLAYTPPRGELPRQQTQLERDMREALGRQGVTFDELLVITNVPVGRLADTMRSEGTLDGYRAALRAAFNPSTAAELCCRRSVEVAWDGTVWDCDFNLAAGVAPVGGPLRVGAVDPAALASRQIAVGDHCYACTAGFGSS